MKKLKLQTLGLSVNELLTREQLKKVMGGSGSGGGCTSNADCATGQMCSTIAINGVRSCVTVARGSSCTSDSDCGNGQKCVNKPVGTGKWCS